MNTYNTYNFNLLFKTISLYISLDTPKPAAQYPSHSTLRPSLIMPHTSGLDHLTPAHHGTRIGRAVRMLQHYRPELRKNQFLDEAMHHITAAVDSAPHATPSPHYACSRMPKQPRELDLLSPEFHRTCIRREIEFMVRHYPELWENPNLRSACVRINAALAVLGAQTYSEY